jgi:hypothetical protein
MTTGRDFKGLEPFILQQGMAFLVSPTAPLADDPRIAPGRMTGTLLDIATTDSLAWHTYRYDRLLQAGEDQVAHLESTARQMAYNLGIPFAQLAIAYQERSDRERTLSNLERAATLISDPQFKEALLQMRMEPFTGPADTPRADTLRNGQRDSGPGTK